MNLNINRIQNLCEKSLNYHRLQKHSRVKFLRIWDKLSKYTKDNHQLWKVDKFDTKKILNQQKDSVWFPEK